MANGNRHDDRLSELSRHYDSMFWTVTSLWAGAIGGLLAYCISTFDLFLSILGLFLTVCAMAFAASFRSLRRRVQDQMSGELAELHRSRGLLRQWPWFLLIFLSLAARWVWLLIEKEEALIVLWLILGIVAVVAITVFWSVEMRTE